MMGMDKRHPGLTPGTATSYLEAASVSLHRHHKPPQEFALTHDGGEMRCEVSWETPSDTCLRGWANQDDATRDGAYACALAAAELTSDLYAMRRAETMTGADYYVAPTGIDPDDLENQVRLEVSGTHCEQSEVRRRLSRKMEQARSGKSNLPALAAVVGFKTRMIMMKSVRA